MNRQHQRSLRRRGGFTLIEFLVCLTLTAVAMNVGVRLFGIILRSYRDVPAASRELQMQSQWLSMMRSDAWRATASAVGDGSQLTLTADAQTITWRQDSGELIRVTPEETRRWMLTRPLRWSEDDALLMLSEGDARVALATPVREAVQP